MEGDTYEAFLTSILIQETPIKDRIWTLQKFIETDRSWFYYIDHLGSGPFDAILEMFLEDTEEDLL